MNEFAKLSSSSPRLRLNSHITVISANCRDFDHKEKLELYERKLAREYTETERNLRRKQKWNLRAEKNIFIKEIYNNNSNTASTNNQENLSPSVDEWLKMSVRRRHTMAASHSIPKINLMQKI